MLKDKIDKAKRIQSQRKKKQKTKLKKNENYLVLLLNWTQHVNPETSQLDT